MTPQESVRLLISDVGGESGEDFIFSDTEIDNFLELSGESVFKAAATALRAIAGNEAQVSKRIKFMELSTDGPAVADALNKLADTYEREYEAEVNEEDDSEVQIAEMVVDAFSYRNARLRKYGIVLT